MDLETRLDLVKSVGEEIITEKELRELLETNSRPVAYDGFEPSGFAHLPFALYRPINLEKMMKAGVRFKLWLADWFAWINNKMNGDLDAISSVGEYFIEVWKAAGVDTKKIDFIWASDSMDQDYWKTVITVAKSTTVARATRALTVMGRKEGELSEVSQYFYPVMQAADVFHLGVDITQLGLDQRRACILAREVAPKLGRKKPVVVSHHMLMGLSGAAQPEGYESSSQLDVEISSKMSKSKPESSIFVHDSEAEIRRKLSKAYCPEKAVESNPVLEYCRYLIFERYPSIGVDRPQKFGGSVSFSSYAELESAYVAGQLHPADLKSAAAFYLNDMIAPIRKHFESGRGKKLYEAVRSASITR